MPLFRPAAQYRLPQSLDEETDQLTLPGWMAPPGLGYASDVARSAQEANQRAIQGDIQGAQYLRGRQPSPVVSGGDFDSRVSDAVNTDLANRTRAGQGDWRSSVALGGLRGAARRTRK